MQKSIIHPEDATTSTDIAWIDLETAARVEITSEDDLFPIEHALGSRLSTGWRAAVPGPQLVRLFFHAPVDLHHVEIHIIDRAAERTQEFALFAGASLPNLREVLRQQFTFSPGGSTEEIETYTVDLPATQILELRIDPDRAHPPAQSQNFASLMRLRLA